MAESINPDPKNRTDALVEILERYRTTCLVIPRVSAGMYYHMISTIERSGLDKNELPEEMTPNNLDGLNNISLIAYINRNLYFLKFPEKLD